MTVHDPLEALFAIAHDAGVLTCPRDLLAQVQREASTFAVPNVDLTHPELDRADLSVRDASVYDLVLVLGRPTAWDTDAAMHPESGALRLLYACRLALQLLPEVVGDVFGRFVLELVDDVQAPRVEHLEHEVSRALSALRGCLHEHDRDEWVDPVALAGALADVHDAVRLVVIWHQTWGELVQPTR